jgi:hypothetical protein
VAKKTSSIRGRTEAKKEGGREGGEKEREDY